MVTRSPSSCSGFTLVELLITLSLTSVLMYGLVSSLRGSMAVFSSASRELAFQRRFERASTGLVRELTNASADSVTPVPIQIPGGPTAWTDRLEFRQVLGWGAGEPAIGGLLRLETRLEAAETNDGTDEDGDGLVDELELVLTREVDSAQPLEVVLARGVEEWFPGEVPNGIDDNGNGLVDEPGFGIVVLGNTLTVRIALSQTDPAETVRIRTRTMQIGLQN